MAFVEFENVGKTYHMGEVEIHALHDTTFQVEKGELVVIVGPSGAGKTTLLNILGGMDSLTEGRVTVVDKGALDCTLKARVECAVFRSCDKSAAGIPWGGVIK